MRLVMRVRQAAVLLCVAVFVAAPAWAGQIVDPATGSIVGIVRDATGAVVPDVAVTVSGPALMTPRQTSSDAAGAYRILRLPPGDYLVSFARQGFEIPEHSVRVGLGFTANLDVTLTLDAQRAEATVTAGSSVLDRHSAASADTFDSKQLDALPSSRSMAGVIGLAHGLFMPSMEVGAGLGLQAGSFSAYGRNSSPRHTIEGIVVTGLFGAGFTPDYGALEEMAILTAAQSAEWPTAGIHTQLVTKSGGNRYAGSIYSAFENRHWQSSNVDATQIARLAPSGGGLTARQANQVWSYRDVNADAGGFVVRDRLWWYSSLRHQGNSRPVLRVSHRRRPRPHVARRLSADGPRAGAGSAPLPLIFFQTTGNYTTTQNVGTGVVSVGVTAGQTYTVLVGAPVDMPAQRYEVTTAVR